MLSVFRRRRSMASRFAPGAARHMEASGGEKSEKGADHRGTTSRQEKARPIEPVVVVSPNESRADDASHGGSGDYDVLDRGPIGGVSAEAGRRNEGRLRIGFQSLFFEAQFSAGVGGFLFRVSGGAPSCKGRCAGRRMRTESAGHDMGRDEQDAPNQYRTQRSAYSLQHGK